MKTKILSLTIALMMLVSVVTAMPVGAIVYDNNDIILDVMDLQNTDSSLDNYTNNNVSTKRYSSWAGGTGKPSWITKGAMSMAASINATFNFNVSKAGTYRVIIAGSGGADAAVTVNVDTTRILYKTVINVGSSTSNAVETISNHVTLTQGAHSLKIARAAGTPYIWNIKLEYVSDEIVVVPAAASTNATVLTVFSAEVPSEDFGWIPKGQVGVKNTTTMTSKVNIMKEGYYDLYLGAKQYNTSTTTPAVEVAVDDVTKASGCSFNIVSGGAASQSKLATAIYLTAGEHTVELTYSGSSAYALVYGFKLAYQAFPQGTVISGVSDAVVTGNASPKTPRAVTDDFGWIPLPSKYVLLANSKSSTSTHTVNVLNDGYYDMHLGVTDASDEFAFDVYDGDTKVLDNSTFSDLDETVTSEINAGQIYLTRGEHKIKIVMTDNSMWYFGIKLSPVQGTDEPGDDVVEGITLVKNDGSAFTSSDIANGATVKAKAVITMDDAADAYIIIAQYTDNTAMKRMIGTVVMDGVSLVSGSNDVTSTNALTLDVDCGYIQAFLWTNDGNYVPLMAGVSVSK